MSEDILSKYINFKIPGFQDSRIQEFVFDYLEFGIFEFVWNLVLVIWDFKAEDH
jgi:hypothetical protein